MTNAFAQPIPQTNAFTLVLDVDARQILVGGEGTASVVPVTTTDGKTFATSAPFDTATPPLGTCGTSDRVTYSSFTFTLTLSGGSFTGHATGAVEISCGDCAFNGSFTAELAGVRDVTPPTLVSAPIDVDPFAPFSFGASEPLPTSATARLVDADGGVVELAPVVVAPDGGAPALVRGFDKPNVVLGAGVGYVVSLAGLVDFAGLTGGAGETLRLGSLPAAPLVPPDGFESATGDTVGGAALLRAGTSPVPPIAGAQSAYVAAEELGGGVLPISRRLLVRLAVPAGATKVSFTSQAVLPNPGAAFGGTLSIGSVGKAPYSDDAFALPTTTTTTTVPLAGGGNVYLSDVRTRAVPLPADVTNEILFEISTLSSSCGGLTPAQSGLLVDDVHLE